MADLVKNLEKSSLKNAIWTVRFAFLFIGIISTVLLLKLAIPYSINLFLSAIPRFWISFQSWLSPPFLYILVNFIIIIIAASSSFQQKLSHKKSEEPEEENSKQKHKQRDSETQKTSQQICSEISFLMFSYEYSPDPGQNSPDPGQNSPDSGGNTSEMALTVVEKSVDSSPPEMWSDISCVADSGEKPPVSASIPVGKNARPDVEKRQRKSVKPSPSPRSRLGVAKRSKHDTLDATWRTITENREMPQSRYLKKSDTWDASPHVELEPMVAPVYSARPELRKSETFNDGAARGSGGLRRERSLSQDELNHRVEAFIKKFNEEIRLERQKSYKHYMHGDGK
ncbi:uncharacterized protein LOC143864199 isoform X2 [Tasmannia lanceolata]